MVVELSGESLAIVCPDPKFGFALEPRGNGTGFIQPVHRGIDFGRIGGVIYSANFPQGNFSGTLSSVRTGNLVGVLFNWFASCWVVVVRCTAYLWSLEVGVFSFYGDFRSCCSAGDYGT